jgi:hypothetical protein
MATCFGSITAILRQTAAIKSCTKFCVSWTEISSSTITVTQNAFIVIGYVKAIIRFFSVF